MDWGFFKRHPFITGAIALVGIVIFVVIARGRSTGDVVYPAASGPSDASILAQAQTAMAQLSSTTKLESERIASLTAIELAGIAAEQKALETTYSKDVALSGIAAQNTLTQAQLEAVRVQSNAAMEALRIQTGAQVTLANKQLALEERVQTQQWQLQFYNAEAQREAVAYDYTRNVLNDARDDANTAALIAALTSKAA